jgi:hypothetical protein
MRRGDTGASSADVESLRKLNEFNAASVDTAKKHRYLEANAWGLAALNRAQALAFVVYFDFQAVPSSTTELVRLCIFDARKCARGGHL